MAYTTVALKEKILEMYPEIEQQNIAVGLAYSEEKNAYIVAFSAETGTLTTHLDKKDADECMNGRKCVYLGVQIAQFIRNYRDRETFARTA